MCLKKESEMTIATKQVLDIISHRLSPREAMLVRASLWRAYRLGQKKQAHKEMLERKAADDYQREQLAEHVFSVENEVKRMQGTHRRAFPNLYRGESEFAEEKRLDDVSRARDCQGSV